MWRRVEYPQNPPRAPCSAQRTQRHPPRQGRPDQDQAHGCANEVQYVTSDLSSQTVSASLRPFRILGLEVEKNNLVSNFVEFYFQKNGRYRRTSRQDIKLQGLAGVQRQRRSTQAAPAIFNALCREPQLLLYRGANIPTILKVHKPRRWRWHQTYHYGS